MTLRLRQKAKLDTAYIFELQRNYYRDKSGSSRSQRYATVTMTPDRVHFAGETALARIDLTRDLINEIESYEVEVKCVINTYAIRSNGQSSYNVYEDQVLYSQKGFIDPASLQPRSEDPSLRIASSSDSAFSFDVATQIPFEGHYPKPGKGKPSLTDLPPTFFMLSSSGMGDKSNNMVSYVIKVTARKIKMISRDERTWTPFAVAQFARPWRESITAAPAFPPPTDWTPFHSYTNVSKNLFSTRGLVEVHLSFPAPVNHPLHIPMSIVIRVSVRTKSPSELLGEGSKVLPLLPLQSAAEEEVGGGSKDDSSKWWPRFLIERKTEGSVDRTNLTHRHYDECRTQWYTSHLDSGFRQQRDERGGEGSYLNSKGINTGGSGEGTPIADDRAEIGLDHGWTWPAHDSESIHFSTPTAPEMAQYSSSRISPRFQRPEKKQLSKFSYVTTATLFGFVDLASAGGWNVGVRHLSSNHTLELQWDIKGLSNHVKTQLCSVDLTSGVTYEERASGLLNDEQVKARVYSAAEQSPSETKAEPMTEQGLQQIRDAAPLPSYSEPSSSALMQGGATRGQGSDQKTAAVPNASHLPPLGSSTDAYSKDQHLPDYCSVDGMAHLNLSEGKER